MASVSKLELLAATALTASNTGSAVTTEMKQVDFGAVIIVSACHADTTVAAKVQHSPDGSTWLDLVSFTNIVGVVGSELKAITAPVLPHLRSVVTLTGTTTAATVSVAAYCDRA